MNEPAMRAVIFDMDGVILDSEPIYRHCCQMAAAELGGELSDENYSLLLGRTEEDSAQLLRGLLGKAIDLDDFRRSWGRLWDESLRRSGIPVKEGFFDLVRLLEERSVPYAIATSTPRARALRSLRAAGLDGRFGLLISGDEVRRGKPAPDIFLEAARRLDLEPQRCLAIEDSDAGILSASAAGMFAIMIPDLKLPSEEAASAAAIVARSLGEVAPIVLDLLGGNGSQ